MSKETKNMIGISKKAIKWSVIILVCVFAVDIVVCFLNIGLWISEFMPTSFHKVFIDESRVFEITEYLDLWFSVLSIFTTAVLSWLLLKVSRKSNEISEKISALEETRDLKALNDDISFVYYQIVYSVKELQRLYIDYFIGNRTDYRQIKIHSDWITTLSKLQSVLSISEIDSIYQFFVDIETINNTSKNQKSVVKDIFLKYTLSCFWDASNYIDFQTIDPLTMLHPEMLSIIMFLLFSFKKKNLLIEEKNSKFIISETDNNWFNGEIELSNGKFHGDVMLTYKNVKLDGRFFRNSFLSGRIKAYYEDSWLNLYEITFKSKTDYHVKLYDISKNTFTGNVIVDADYTNNVFDTGFLIFKKGGEVWEGVVKNNGYNFEMVDGIIHHRLVEDSTREYNYDAEERRSEEELERQNDPQYIESLAKETLGEPVGYKVFEDFVYEKGNLVRRENTMIEDKYSYL